MAQQAINVGTIANDGTGDSIRAAFQKVNANDTELYTAVAAKAPLDSPAITGTPTAPTASGTTNTTQIATTAMVQAALAAYIAAQDVLVFRGGIDCSANPNYPAADAGHVYKVSAAGKIGGSSGPNVEVGDVLTCTTDGSASGTHVTVGANWIISQVNIDGAVTGPTSATDARIAVFDGTTGKLIKDGGKAVADLVAVPGAWTAYTPTVTPGSGAFTAASATGRWQKIGKTVVGSIKITITTNGTAAGYVRCTPPIAVRDNYSCMGRETAMVGNFLFCNAQSGGDFILLTPSSTYPGGDGYVLEFTFSYETT